MLHRSSTLFSRTPKDLLLHPFQTQEGLPVPSLYTFYADSSPFLLDGHIRLLTLSLSVKTIIVLTYSLSGRPFFSVTNPTSSQAALQQIPENILNPLSTQDTFLIPTTSTPVPGP